MKWEELCEKAKEMGAGIGKQCIYFGKLEFDEDGHIYLDPFCLDDEVDVNFCISSERSPEQMYQIMKALQ